MNQNPQADTRSRPAVELRARISYFLIFSEAVQFYKDAIIDFPMDLLSRPTLKLRELYIINV